MTYSSFQNPRKNWSNIDILYTEEGRQEVKSVFPEIYPLIDWPELRSFFDKWERSAIKLKERNRYCGLAAVLMSVLGLSILAFVPWAATYVRPEGLTLAGIGLLGAGIVSGLWLRLVSSATRKWLISRFWAERARQFQFQYLISHLHQLVEAMKSETGRDDWLKNRAEAFRQFAFQANNDPTGICDGVVFDDAEQKAWLESAGRKEASFPPPSPERGKIISYLKQLRVGYQLQYARSQNLSANIYSKKGLAASAAKAVFVLIGAFILITLGIGVYILTGRVDNADVNLLFGVQGFFAAMIAGVRVMEEGLGWRAEASRYLAYEAGLALAEAKMQSTSDDDIASGLLAVEKLAYDELRGFLIAHREPRFII
jgi:hypothetical protein